MPTLNEILIDIDDRYSNSFTDEQKIRWLNTTQREVFKDLAIDDIYEISTIKDEAIYEIPEEIEFELIKSLTLIHSSSYF